MRAEDLEQGGLHARLLGADRLHAVATGDDTSDVPARQTVVLLDDDTTSWSSWDTYADLLARDTGAHAVRISDGGITGPAFFDHVRRSGRPVVNSPKGQTTPLAPDLVQRPVVAPEIHRTWSLVPGPWSGARTIRTGRRSCPQTETAMRTLVSVLGLRAALPPSAFA